MKQKNWTKRKQHKNSQSYGADSVNEIKLLNTGKSIFSTIFTFSEIPINISKIRVFK